MKGEDVRAGEEETEMETEGRRGKRAKGQEESLGHERGP